jgi:hypothetical protein
MSAACAFSSSSCAQFQGSLKRWRTVAGGVVDFAESSTIKTLRPDRTRLPVPNFGKLAEHRHRLGSSGPESFQ